MSTLAAGEDLSSQLEQTLGTDPDNPFHHFNLGIQLWKTGEAAGGDESKQLKERASEHFLASAKLNPSGNAVFWLLGNYYSQVSVDSQRAAECYQRAVTLNPADAEAGEWLCDLLDEICKKTLEVSVCRKACPIRRLGYLLVQQNKWTEAVQTLQNAIPGPWACADLWEALGLADQRLGMFTAAVNGVEQFRHALKIAPRNVFAHFGLASCLLAWSRECVNSGEFCGVAALLKEASNIAIAATCITEHLSKKLHGDIQILKDGRECSHGTTVLIRRCDIGWAIVVDSRSSRIYEDYSEIATDRAMKCNFTASRNRVTVCCGRVQLSRIIVGAIRKFTCENPDTDLVGLGDAVEALIVARLVDTGLQDEAATDSQVGRIAVVDRNRDQLLNVSLERRRGHTNFRLSRDIMRSCHMGSGPRKISKQIENWHFDEKDVSTVVKTMWTNLRSAARQDKHTGGHGLVFTGGTNNQWECIRCRSLE